MLIFKDSILGFVAGVQLTQNNMVRLDMDSLEIMTPDMIADMKKSVPLMTDYAPAEGEQPTNSQLYRIYIKNISAATLKSGKQRGQCLF